MSPWPVKILRCLSNPSSCLDGGHVISSITSLSSESLRKSLNHWSRLVDLTCEILNCCHSIQLLEICLPDAFGKNSSSTSTLDSGQLWHLQTGQMLPNALSCRERSKAIQFRWVMNCLDVEKTVLLPKDKCFHAQCQIPEAPTRSGTSSSWHISDDWLLFCVFCEIKDDSSRPDFARRAIQNVSRRSIMSARHIILKGCDIFMLADEMLILENITSGGNIIPLPGAECLRCRRNCACFRWMGAAVHQLDSSCSGRSTASSDSV